MRTSFESGERSSRPGARHAARPWMTASSSIHRKVQRPGPGWPRPRPSVTMWNDVQRASVHQRPDFAPLVDVPQGRPLRWRVALRLRLLHLVEPLAKLDEIRSGLDARHFAAE